MKTKTSMVILLLLVALTGACAFKGGDKEYVHPPTLGAELSDLKKAHDRGAIEAEEYHLKKQEIIDAAR